MELLLAILFGLYLLQDAIKIFYHRGENRSSFLAKTAFASLPIILFGAWYFSAWGKAFRVVDEINFGRSFLNFGEAFHQFQMVFANLSLAQPETTIYYLLEIGILLIGVFSCFCIVATRAGIRAIQPEYSFAGGHKRTIPEFQPATSCASPRFITPLRAIAVPHSSIAAGLSPVCFFLH